MQKMMKGLGMGAQMYDRYDVFRMCSECVPNVFRMCSECVPNVFLMCS